MRMEHCAVPLVWAYAPFRVHVGISNECALGSLPFVFPFPFVLLFVYVWFGIVNAGRQMCFECPVLHDFLKHTGEIQRVWIETPLLCCSKEVLYAYISDIQDACCK